MTDEVGVGVVSDMQGSYGRLSTPDAKTSPQSTDLLGLRSD